MGIGSSMGQNQPCIHTWQAFCHALKERFYLSGFLQALLARWLQLRQLQQQSVRAYIDVFCKLCLQLHIKDPDEVLIIKFNSGLLFQFRREVELFESNTLDKAFLKALAVERKLNLRPQSWNLMP